MFGFKKNKCVVGLDVSSSSVKLLELSRKGQCFHVESYAVLPLPAGAVVDGTYKNLEHIGEVISKVFKLSRATTNQSSVAVSNSHVITKLITMDASLSSYEMEQQILFEAPQHIPNFKADEIYLDFYVLEENELDESKVDVIIGACKSDVINQLQEGLEAGNANCKIIDLESMCIERAFAELLVKQLPSENPSDLVTLIDIGANNMNLRIMRGGKTLSQKDFNFGGKKLTEDIQKRYNMNEAEAGRAKKFPELLPESAFEQVFDPFNERIIQFTNTTLSSFYSSTEYQEINYVVLCGGAAMTMGLKDAVESHLGIPTFIADPFQKMTIDSRVDLNKLKSDAPAMLIACGLAMREVKYEC